ncbi:Ferric reductase transmembrane component [Penicillium ucsense]|uniref:ferric-chelate reductase (NADPH) n=1 Tax=Penicillium ucsense TaxID=2839758 RepID=A0A8J8W102_9EURO|nr:Ferric reductase transmembrane component [Penicillium ucsense]KAF7738192.1 Ferric reductase transmembrane component [Penicillium ucsense]
MDMMSDMPMGSMSMGNGAPSLLTMQKMYWAVVGSAIGLATIVNLLDWILARHRLRDTSLTPAKPKSLFFSIYATITAIVREVSHASLRPLTVGSHTIHFPPLGPVLIILANLITILVLCFYKLDTLDVWQWENIGYSTGCIAICQLPLIFLLAGRQNIIGFLAGMSYASLNWYHRWAARTLWLTSTIHMCFWFRDWGRYDYIAYELVHDDLTKRGFAAWCLLTFILITSVRPIRGLSYEVFVLQHLVTFIGFIVAVWMHVPNEVRVYIWIPIGLLVFDRLARYIWGAYLNLALFHRQTDGKTIQRLWTHSAKFAPMPGNVTRVTITNPGIHWQPGQHVFLTCHSIAPFQCHPFTIASLPDDQRLEFYIRAKTGATRRLFRFASKNDDNLGRPTATAVSQDRTVFIEGPYGAVRPLRQFDSVVLFAGGTGATFTVPLLRDIVSVWNTDSRGETSRVSRSVKRLAATKRIRFVWVIKSRAQLGLFESQLQAALADVAECQFRQPDGGKELEISIYITCDERLEVPHPVSTNASPASSAVVTEEAHNLSEKNGVDEKDNISVRSLSTGSLSSSAAPAMAGRGCLPGGGCCCTTQIMDEDQIDTCTCKCSGPVPVPAANSGVGGANEQTMKSSEPPTPLTIALPIFAGRPHPRTIIRKVLEKAEGESAVVVCGPQGLSDDVRRSVVSLSDERAVHKGTGAQGIYLHIENFGY